MVPPQPVPQTFWDDQHDDTMWIVLENLRRQRNFIATLSRPVAATGTQVGSGGWD
jgi:hypothetical protein